MANDVFYIAGRKTSEDWLKFKNELPGANEDLWAKAFEEYFRERLKLRYLRPIELLQEHGTFEGEGFSIVAIQCTLIEFLASVSQGKNYRFVRRGDPPLNQYEYQRSGELFTRFLCDQAPFCVEFSEAIAEDFYASIRCGLLHEATTKNDWKIWASGRKLIDAGRKIVFRDNLQTAIEDYIEQYGRRLLTERRLQEAFVRKFDYLAAG